MIKPRLILCGGLIVAEDDPQYKGRHTVTLSTIGTGANVNVRLEDVAKIFLQHLSPRLEDLLEIASYVYTADCATRRNGNWADEGAIEPWQRDFYFVIPVRDLEFWNLPETKEQLVTTLQLLSDDIFSFEFHAVESDIPKQQYLEFADDEDWPFYDVERVIMFSGGLDSLAGAVESAAKGQNLVLVSHRPVSTLSSRQRELFAALRSTFNVPMIHVPVWINKQESKRKEPSQRTRSFLYGSLGAIVAESVRAAGVRFFENGVVSLNLPVADEVLQARASRTTHPLALQHFSKLFSMVVSRLVEVDNPYIFLTKTEVVSKIADNSCSDLVGLSCSCSHPVFQSKVRWHCGTCSQCIDRRIATLAAGLAECDRADDYVSDVFVGPRKEGYERNMAVNYVRHGIELNRMSEDEMAAKFNRDLGRACRAFAKRREAAQRLIEMHNRHGQTVERIVQEQLQKHLPELVSGSLDESSMLAMVAGQKHRVSAWKSFADRIVHLLREGLPRACKSEKPRNEPRLQEICDGILAAQNGDLIREFPFMRWGSNATKPDWSNEALCLWVELKYVRDRKDIGRINGDIAEDITKYGDNDRRVLFIVYDPHHLITDETSFMEPLKTRTAMQVAFIR